MCGIAGVVAWDERYRTSRDTLARLSAAIAHRGPDGEGLWFNHEAEISPGRPQVAFAHRRLAIIDPDPRADQPFTDGDGRAIVFNGEIYNYRELKRELTALKPDYAWRTNGDTEVLLVAYAAWGEKCVEHLNGMFAFAVWDENDKSLFLARDRMGQKPLYVVTANGAPCPAVAFASELEALRPTGFLAGRSPVDPSALLSYLAFGNCGWATLDAHASQILPGWTERETHPSSETSSKMGRYFFANEGASADEVSATADDPPAYRRRVDAGDINGAVRRAVQRQLVSDVPLGVFLSGGVDSGVIAACARAHGPVSTFSVAFDDPRYDESRYARELARHLGTDHHEFRVTPNVVEDLPKLAAVFGDPFADSSAIPTHYLARETRKHVTVALSGDGGDELFGGYDRYRAMRKAAYVPRRLGRLIAPLARPFRSGHPKARRARVARFASSLALAPADRYESFVRVFDDATLGALLGKEPTRPDRRVAAVFEKELERTGCPVRAALATDRRTYLPDDLLTKVDRASMLHALEVRSPFMDHELVGFAASLTADQLLKGGPKRMLREAFAGDLPGWVFTRKKMGFAVPIGEWMRGELRPMLRDHLFAARSFARGHFDMRVVERLVDEH